MAKQQNGWSNSSQSFRLNKSRITILALPTVLRYFEENRLHQLLVQGLTFPRSRVKLPIPASFSMPPFRGPEARSESRPGQLACPNDHGLLRPPAP